MGIPLFKENLDEDWEKITEKKRRLKHLQDQYRYMYGLVKSYENPPASFVKNLNDQRRVLEELKDEIYNGERAFHARKRYLGRK